MPLSQLVPWFKSRISRLWGKTNQQIGADSFDIEAMIAAQPPEWSLVVDNDLFDHVPKTMTSAEDAMLLLGYVAKCWHPSFLRLFGEGGKWLNRDEVAPEYKSEFDSWVEQKSKLDSWDARLASFVTKHPGTLESLLGDRTWQERFALTQTRKDAEDRKEGNKMGGLPTSVMSNFLNEANFVEGEFLWRSMRACDQTALIRSVLSCQSRFGAVFYGHEPWELLSGIARWLGPERFPTVRGRLEDVAPPELLDALGVWACGNDEDVTDMGPIGDSLQLPDILPSDDECLVELGGDEISDRIAAYRGVTVPELHANLVKQGFLGEGEKIGELILNDAMTLQDLGVSRHALAAAINDAFLLDQEFDEKTGKLLSGQPPFVVKIEYTLGHHQDPFHSVDTYSVSPEVRGSADVLIVGKAGKLRLSDMHPYLIRRACFFEGKGRYRLDPKRACKVLGLA